VLKADVFEEAEPVFDEIEADEVVLAYGGTGNEVYAPTGVEDEPAADDVLKASKPD
jgi:hypothetical protein